MLELMKSRKASINWWTFIKLVVVVLVISVGLTIGLKITGVLTS